MAAVVHAVEEVFHAAGEVVGAVVHAAENVVNFVVDEVVKPVAQVVEKTIESALKDPIATLARVAAVATGQFELLPLIGAADVVAHGGNFEDVLKGAAISYVASGVGDFAGAELAQSGAGDFASTIGKNVASGATGAALSGKDIGAGAISGALNYAGNKLIGDAVSGINKEINQPADTSDSNYKLPDYMTGEGETSSGGLPTDTSNDENFNMDDLKKTAEAPIDTNYAIDSNVQHSNVPTSEQGLNPAGAYNGLSLDSVTGQAPSLAKMGGGSGLTVSSNEILGNPNSFINDPALKSETPGTISKAGFTDAAATPSLGDPRSFINDPNVLGKPVISVADCNYDVKLPKVNLASLLQDKQAKQRNALCIAMGGFDMNTPWLNSKEQMLRNKLPIGCESGTGGASVGDLSHIYGSLTPELRNELADRGIGQPQSSLALPSYGEISSMGAKNGGSIENYACGGTSCSPWGSMAQYMPKFYNTGASGMLAAAGGRRQPFTLAQLKQLQSQAAQGGNMGGMAKGGLPSEYRDEAPKGHNPEFVTGLTGYYACGGGTGQSDDIPAMLHDGDYVMDADVVAALGDGSSKAGREVLDGFRSKVPHQAHVKGKPVAANIADGEYVFPGSFVTALGGGDNKKGADILDGLREKLRAHKRSAPTSKIPPKAKSPLDYIKGSKG